MLVATVCAQVVTARVRCTADGTHEAAGEVHVVVVADVSHHFATELAAVQVREAGEPVKR